jgi:hypothetical protein
VLETGMNRGLVPLKNVYTSEDQVPETYIEGKYKSTEHCLLLE